MVAPAGRSEQEERLLQKLRRIMRKGDRKSSAFAAEEALKFYRRSLSTLEKLPGTSANLERKLETLLLLGQINNILGRWNDALEMFGRVLVVGDQPFFIAQRAEAAASMGHINKNRGALDKAEEQFLTSIELARRTKDPVREADALRGIGYVLWRRGRFAQAAQTYQQTLLLLQGTGQDELLAKAYIELGNCHSEGGNRAEAVRFYEDAIGVLRGTRDYYELARAYNNLGDLCLKHREFPESIRYFEKSAQYARRINDLQIEGWALFNMAEAQARAGELDAAEDANDRAQELLTRMDDRVGLAQVFQNYGLIHRLRRDWEQSERYYTHALELLRKMPTKVLLGQCLYEYAQVREARGDLPGALEGVREAHEIFSALGRSHYSEPVKAMVARLESLDGGAPAAAEESGLPIAVETDPADAMPLPAVDVPSLESDYDVGTNRVVLVHQAGDEEDRIERSARLALEAELQTAAPRVRVEHLTLQQGSELAELLTVDWTPAAAWGKLRFRGFPPVAQLLRLFSTSDPQLLQPLPDDLDDEEAASALASEQPTPEAPPPAVVEEKATPAPLLGGIRPAERLVARTLPPAPALRAEAARIVTVVRSGPQVPSPLEPVLSAAPPLEERYTDVEPAAGGGTTEEVLVRLLRPHYNYHLATGQHDLGLRLLSRADEEGWRTVCITRPPLQPIRDRFGLPATTFLTLSTRPSALHINVEDLPRLLQEVERLVTTGGGRTLVLLDRLDYLLHHHQFSGVLDLIHQLGEIIGEVEAVMVVVIDPVLIDEQQRGLLERELTPLRP